MVAAIYIFFRIGEFFITYLSMYVKNRINIGEQERMAIKNHKEVITCKKLEKMGGSLMKIIY